MMLLVDILGMLAQMWCKERELLNLMIEGDRKFNIITCYSEICVRYYDYRILLSI